MPWRRRSTRSMPQTWATRMRTLRSVMRRTTTSPGTRRKSCRFCSNCSDGGLLRDRRLRYRRSQVPELGVVMGSRIRKPTAAVVETRPPTVSGTAGKHPVAKALRAVVSRITTPLLPDDYLQLANPLWSARELRGRILDVQGETSDSATLVIKPGWRFEFDYQPGQYIGIGLLVDGRWRWRSYSLTSAPVQRSGSGPERTVTISVKAMPEGFLSTHLVDGVEPGTIVRLAAPQGNFVLPDPAPASVLFLTGGSGITPVMSMLRTLVRRDQITDVLHVHSAPTESDVMFGGELEQLARDHAGYQLRLRTTRSQGRLDLTLLDTEVPDWR